MRRYTATMLRRLLTIAVCAATVAFGPGVDTARAANDGPVIESLRGLLKTSKKVARVYYAGRCQSDDSYAVQLPNLDVQAPQSGETGLAAVRTMFRNDKNVVVTEGPTGIINIRIGEFADTVLQTRISRLNFTPLQQYNWAFAVDEALLNNDDMVSAIKSLGLTQPVYIYGYLVIFPTPGWPHLPPSMSDVTADQVLDTVATTFSGIVLYGICPQSGLFSLNFVYVGQ
jgi:hypothetical protein